jgi:hypothetical protein
MYRRQRRHLYYGGEIYKHYSICPPQPQLSLHRRAALSSDSNGTRSYIAEGTQSAVYIVRCLCPLTRQAGIFGHLWELGFGDPSIVHISKT